MSSSVLNQLDLAWELLEAGHLEQTKVAAFISRAIESVDDSTSHVEVFRFSRAGKKVGTIRRNAKGLLVQLDAAVLSPERELQLQTFVERLLEEEL